MRIRVPHVFVILVVAVLLAAAATWVVPGGSYERHKDPSGRTVVVPDSFKYAPAKPVGLWGALKAIPEGLTQAAMISVCVLIMGGTWQVLGATGTIAVGLDRTVRVLKGREILVIPLLMLVFGAVAAIIGAAELAIVYIPVVLPLALTLGFDSMTAAAIVLLSTTAAFTATLTNPFSVGIGQQIAGLPLYSGVGFRLIVLGTFMAVSIGYVMWYARRVQRNPDASLTREEDQRRERKVTEAPQVGLSHRLILLTLVGAFVAMVYGVLRLQWFLNEISALFFLVAVLAGVLGRLGLDRTATEFARGCGDVVVAAMVVGLARSIVVVVEKAGIIDTIVHGLAGFVSGLPGAVTAVCMLIAVMLLEFVVPSASGKALITMPILVPLADVVGVTRQTAVLVYQLGDGLCNAFYPIEGGTMAVLSMAGVPYNKWIRFVGPLMVVWFILATMFLVIAHAIRWGPF